MASIVEWEARYDDEKPRIAGVYLNRLLGRTSAGTMRLQADPTVQYALMQTDGGPMRRLFLRDYGFAHPYNTYQIDGLPPGPINNPSDAAIDGVLDNERARLPLLRRQPTAPAATTSAGPAPSTPRRPAAGASTSRSRRASAARASAPRPLATPQPHRPLLSSHLWRRPAARGASRQRLNSFAAVAAAPEPAPLPIPPFPVPTSP